MSAGVRGILFDGQCAQRRSAVLEIAGDMLVITLDEPDAQNGAGRLNWRIEQVELTELPAPGAPVRLRCGRVPGTLFVVSDAENIRKLSEHLPHLLDHSRRRRRRWIFSAAALGISLLVVLGIIMGWPRIALQIAHQIPMRWEEPLGESTLSRLRMVKESCDGANDRVGLNAIEDLTRRLGAGPGSPTPVSVHVVKWSYRNAFTLPGRHVVFTSGIIEFMKHPDELAGILAHEIAHVQQRHNIVALIEDVGLAVFLTAIIGDRQVTDLSHQVLLAAYSRELESEADDIGRDLLTRADISSAGFARFFKRLQKTENSDDDLMGLPDYLRKHPPPGERAERAQEDAHAGTPAMSAEEWAAVKAMCGE